MWDTKLIPKENFRELVEQKKVVRTSAAHGGIIYEVLRLLEQNAATLEGIAEKLNIEKKTAYNAIVHLRQRHNKRIRRYYNRNDRKFYYFLEE